MTGNRTRISARLNPVANALASVPSSASISTVFSCTSASGATPTTTIRHNSTLPATDSISSEIESLATASTTSIITTRPDTQLLSPRKNTTTPIQGGHTNDESDLTNDSMFPILPKVAPTAVSQTTTEPTSDIVSLDTIEVSTTPANIPNDAGSDSTLITSKDRPAPTTTTGIITNEEFTSSLQNNDIDVWRGHAPSSEDNIPVESDTLSSVTTIMISTPATPTTSNTLPDARSGSSPIQVIDLTTEPETSDSLSDNTESVHSESAISSNSPTSLDKQASVVGNVQSRQSLKSLPLTVRLRLRAAEAQERKRKRMMPLLANQLTSSSTPAQILQTSLSLLSNNVQQDGENLTENQQRMRRQLLSNRATNPLDLPEIRANIARYLTRKDLRSCLLVSEGWWQSFHPALWTHLRPVYKNVLGNMNDYPSAALMHKYSHLIRTFEYNGHGTVLTSMVPSIRSQYKKEDLEWRRSQAEEETERSWVYVDEDAAIDGVMKMDLDESLSDFERRIERKKNERVTRMSRMQNIIAANKRQNEVSRFLNDTTDYSKRFCHKLERLILTDTRFSREWGSHYKYWLRLMQLNSETLYAIELNYAIRSTDACLNIYNTIFILEHLRELTLVDNDIDVQKTKVFIEVVCPRLRKLELKKVRIEIGPFPSQPAMPTDCTIMHMPRMRSLTLNQIHTRISTFGLDFIKMCPGLVELNFRPQWGMIIKTFTDTITEKLPNLTHLTFRMDGLSDLDVSSMIKAVPELRKLDISGCVFGMMAANNLTTRHLLSITYLDIRNCALVAGMLIQQVLGECRHLRVFMADQIRAKDIVNNSIYPQWACIGLKELTIDIRGSPRDQEITTRVYQQLASLECLEYLNISRHQVNDDRTTLADLITESEPNCLTLGLDNGLKLLRTLKHLHTLIFRGISDNAFGLVELQWAVLAWPRLSCLGGQMIKRKTSQYNTNVHPNQTLITSREFTTATTTASGSGSNDASNSSSSTSSSRPTLEQSSVHRRITLEEFLELESRGASSHAEDRNSNGIDIITAANGKQACAESQAGLLSATLRQLGLHHRIQVLPHPEDKISMAVRKKRKLMLLGDSSEEERERERERPRSGQFDPRYRLDFRD
ncbi:hypothetical protein FBU30_010688 [Linnemannia zychae]|nr:hypothetical protein FBU30_010688 [Linnemannia zychae]